MKITKIPSTSSLNVLVRDLSPSTFIRIMSGCAYPAVINAAIKEDIFENKILIPSLFPQTYFGTITHKLCKERIKGNIPDDKTFTDKWEEEIKHTQDELKKQYPLVTIDLKDYSKMYESLRYVNAISEYKDVKNVKKPLKNVLVKLEEWVSIPGYLRGRVDMIRISPESIEVVDYKSGEIDDEKNNIKESIVLQLNLYAICCECQYNKPVTKLTVIKTADHPSRINIPIRRNQFSHYILMISELLSTINEAIAQDKVESLQVVNEKDCRLCNCKHMCKAYLNSELKTKDVIIEGTVDNINNLPHFIEMRGNKGERLVVYGLENISFDDQHELPGKHLVFVNVSPQQNNRYARTNKTLIFERKSPWETTSDSVGTISLSGRTKDSELEIKFTNTLENIARNNNWKFNKISEEGKNKYELRIIDSDSNTDIVYSVIPQFPLTIAYGINHYVSNFQIVCTSARINGEVVSDDELPKLPKWAIFMDGYNHAKAPNICFYEDKNKRDSIRNLSDCKIYSWTITWKDIQLYESGHDDALKGNSVTRLIQLLQNPKDGAILKKVLGYIMSSEDFMGNGGTLYSGELHINKSMYDNLTDNSTDEEVASALRGCVTYNWHLQKDKQEIDQENWIEFWRRYNILQFFNNEVSGEARTTVVPSKEKRIIDRDEVKMYYPGMENIVDILLDNHIEFDYEGKAELINDDDIVIATAGMILHEVKIAINADPESEKVFQDYGFRTIKSEEFDINDIIKIKKHKI